MQSQWQPIRTVEIGKTILLANKEVGYVCVGYGEWMSLNEGKLSLPRFISLDPEGMGRFKPTHWMPLPEPPK